MAEARWNRNENERVSRLLFDFLPNASSTLIRWESKLMLRYLPIAFLLCSWLLFPSPATAQDASSGLIEFNRDIRPILASKCLKCHGDKRANNDFRVDEEDTLLTYIEAGESAVESMLWSDYLTTDDEDLHMPPPEQPQLTGSELAAIKLWIEEGAVWQDPVDANSDEATPAESDPKKKSLIGALWSFQGLFHPAAIHFPLGLLSASMLFLLASLKLGDSFRSAAFHSLWLGALGAVGACVMGWSYAQHEGYGSPSFDVINNPIDLHRWLGIFVAVVALITVPLARSAYSDPESPVKQKRWLIGSILIGLAVGATGYLGGELSYGNNHYQKEFRHLFLDSEAPANQGLGDEEPAAP